MRILLATAHPYLPQIAGGAQSSMHELATALIEAGHHVAVLAGLTGQGWTGWQSRLSLKVTGKRIVADQALGYPVYRGWNPVECATDATADFDPDIVCLQSGLPVAMSTAFRAAGVPTMIYFRNVEADDLGGSVRGSADGYLANSRFTAARVAERYGVEASVIRPLVDRDRYRTATSRRFVTFVNPHPLKGRDVAFAVARACPDHEFLFVVAWTLGPEDEAALAQVAEDCPNVTICERTHDMKAIYASTRIVFAPSQWEEAWGRIATEAHVSGIPVLASDIGGLPEAVGPGGVLVAPDASVQVWVETLKALDDPALYRLLVEAALAFSKRPELDRQSQLSTFLIQADRAIAEFRSLPLTRTMQPILNA